MPAPPTVNAELMAWLQNWTFYLAMADEILLFAPLCLILSIAALYKTLVKVNAIQTLLGCSLLAVNIPVYLILVLILGGLVYPVYDLELSPDIYKLVLSMYYGGLHLAAIIWSIATIILSFVIRKRNLGQSAAYLGFVAGIWIL